MKDNNNGILLESGTNEVEFMRFGLGSTNYGVNVAKVRQAIVYDRSKLSCVPGAPRGVEGNYLYRGECIPIISLRAYVGLGEYKGDTPELLLICEFNQCVIGFVVDSIRDIMRCSWNCLVPSHIESDSLGHAVLTGNIVFKDEITPILDVEAVLAQLIPSSGISRDEKTLRIEEKPSNKTKKIVYCEDSSIVQKVLLKALNELGFSNIHAFSSGAEGLNYLKDVNPGDIDLIISDIEMPKMDGLTLCKEVRTQDHLKKVPFVFFSSTVTDEMRRKCEQVGGNGAFSKPEIAALAEFIDKQLNG